MLETVPLLILYRGRQISAYSVILFSPAETSALLFGLSLTDIISCRNRRTMLSKVLASFQHGFMESFAYILSSVLPFTVFSEGKSRAGKSKR